MEEPKEYTVEVSEAAEVEADQIFLWMQNHSLEGAKRWYAGLLKAYQSLEMFPYRWQAVPGRTELRRMLYGNYRIVYRIIEPDKDSETPLVRILHVYHGARYTGDDENP